MRLKALAGASLLCWAATTLAQESKPAAPADAAAEAPKPPPPPQPWKFEFHGFVSASLFAQDGGLGTSEGQQANFALTQPKTDRLIFSGDVRQSRFNWSISGPKVFAGATPKGVLEIDFFGNFGAGSFGDVSLTPRLRLAYSELNWGNHRIQIGQQFDLSFAMAPVSLSHIGFPLGFGTGNLGWRRPGIFAYHTLGDPTSKDAMKWEFAWEVGRSQWQDLGGIGAATCTVNATPANTGDRFGNCLGETSGLPAVQARLTGSLGQAFSAFVYGHWSRIDRNGVDVNDGALVYNNLDTLAGGAGFKLVGGPLTLAATGYYGKNTGPLVGGVVGQFAAIGAGDVHELGGWAQLGFNLTKEFSVWGFIGAQKPLEKDALAAGFTRIQNVVTQGMLQYRDGGYALGFEWIHYHTRMRNGDAPDVNQYIASANYFF